MSKTYVAAAFSQPLYRDIFNKAQAKNL